MSLRRHHLNFFQIPHIDRFTSESEIEHTIPILSDSDPIGRIKIIETFCSYLICVLINFKVNFWILLPVMCNCKFFYMAHLFIIRI